MATLDDAEIVQQSRALSIGESRTSSHGQHKRRRGYAPLLTRRRALPARRQVAGMLALQLKHLRPPPLRLYLTTPSLHRHRHDSRSRDPQIGTTTPAPIDNAGSNPSNPFHFSAGYAGWAKRPTRPFPPPFFSRPSGSFSDPLSTYNRSVDRRGTKVNGEMIRGVTIGDDAVLVSENLIGANDGVGAWATRKQGCAPLWSRLILHFWALAAEKDGNGGDMRVGGEDAVPDPVGWLTEAYMRTQEALSEPNEWLGTTTASSALLHWARAKESGEGKGERPVVYVTQLGDSKVMIVRPEGKKILFETEEQWHYFDCPRQLGTNSPDTPAENAVMTEIEVEEDDIVLAMSDGVTDNLWAEEISETAVTSLETWRASNLKKNEEAAKKSTDLDEGGGGESLAEGMRFVAQEIVLAARKIAEDPFAASPFMERAVEEGLAIEGGKMDDISVVVAAVRRRGKG